MRPLLLAGICVLHLTFPCRLTAQWCNYPVRVSTNKDYCIGSTLSVSSSHTLQKIIWYKNGLPVDTALAAQYLSPNGITVAGGHGDGRANNQVRPGGVAVDDAGNVYVASSDWNVITKWAPGAGSGVVIADGTTNHFDIIGGLYLDQMGNLYVNDYGFGRVMKFTPGSSTGIVVASLGNPNWVEDDGMTMDCAGDIYLSYYDKYNLRSDSNYTVYRFTPGTDSGIAVAGGHGQGPGPNQLDEAGGSDQAGNLFAFDGYYLLKEWAPGAPAGSIFAHLPNILEASILVTGDDTVYVGNNFGQYANSEVDQVNRSGSSTRFLGGNGAGAGASQIGFVGQMTIDIHGNFYVCDIGNYRVQKFTRSSKIDPTFTPVTAGKYYAVVRDFRGYTVTSDTIYINDPQAGPPQVSITATDSNAAVCVPITFTAQIANPGAYYTLQWEVSGVKVGGDSVTYTNNLFSNGDQVLCILSAQAGCSAGLASDTSNIIDLHIDPHGTATVSITASQDTLCQGMPIEFKATVTNGAAQPGFGWWVNGVPVPGDDSAAWQSDSLHNGDVVYCRITSDDLCGLAKSNSIPLIVGIPPSIAPGQVFHIEHGHKQTLEPEVTGNITSWLWTPGLGLSDSMIEDPVADPPATTLYTLKVASPGCPADSGTILVDVFTPLSVPNAFTPNGDGHNDRFYVLGGPVNSEVRSMAVFNRWGQRVFAAQHATPGDAQAGWDGRINGVPAPAGTYVYFIVLSFPGGATQEYKGAIELIR